MAFVVPEDIVDAARNDDVVALERWFAPANDINTPDPNARDRLGYPLLFAATTHECLAAIRALVAHGADVRRPTSVMFTPLHEAAFRRRPRAARLLLDFGADVDAKNNEATTPLMNAAFVGAVGVCAVLLAAGADPNVRNGKGLDARELTLVGRAHASPRESEPRRLPPSVRFLDAVRRAGGWRRYAKEPRISLLSLRLLSERGRATTDDALLARVFAAASSSGSRVVGLPSRFVFYRVLAFWRSDRDALAAGERR
jgi:hypothetical protein